MRVGLLTREFPPDVYGGAGVHVDFLARELRRLVDLSVHTWGDSRDGATGHRPAAGLADANAALKTLSVDLSIANATGDCDVVHSHTWYANLAGHLAKLLHGVPHVMTAHSLEPRRPWKAEQLGGGYAISSWAERTAIEAADAVIAVSQGMRADLLDAYPRVNPDRVHVVHNGIDPALYAPDEKTDLIESLGVDSRSAVRIVRRAHHPAEGRAPPGAGGTALPTGHPGGAVRGGAGHARDRRGVPRARRRPVGRAARSPLGRGDAAADAHHPAP